MGRVGMWRGCCRLNISVAAPFVWRCLSGSTVTPFPHPAHRTGLADFPHPALGQDITPSPTARRAQARSDGRVRSTRTGAGVDRSRPCVAYLVLDAQPSAQPHSGVVVDRPVRLGDGANIEVVRPSAQRARKSRPGRGPESVGCHSTGRKIAAVSIVGRSEAEIKALRLSLNRLPAEARHDRDDYGRIFRALALMAALRHAEA
jgi:hypothetical protein